jgi:uncharacterized protein DUF2604
MEANAVAGQQEPGRTEPEHAQIELQIAYNGVVRKLDHVQPQELVQALLARAIALFNVTDRPHAQGLFREDGTEVSVTQSVADAGLQNDQLLYLRPRTPQGG